MAEPTDGAHHQRDPSLTGKFMLAPAAPPPGREQKVQFCPAALNRAFLTPHTQPEVKPDFSSRLVCKRPKQYANQQIIDNAELCFGNTLRVQLHSSNSLATKTGPFRNKTAALKGWQYQHIASANGLTESVAPEMLEIPDSTEINSRVAESQEKDKHRTALRARSPVLPPCRTPACHWQPEELVSIRGAAGTVPSRQLAYSHPGVETERVPLRHQGHATLCQLA
ncbi:hypothetical protein Anapl_17510 [Anas platyrhynchos]|uniref:Uncharacterized protein n=1 Tax=Anas platyrhynchos TaxID=8839 RepID=R0L8N5_ANAPL|nr:hypothetical protein Anapl_17510 [Anas platyrhynchos]